MSSSPQPLLEVRDLRIAFGGHEAVRGVSFDVRAGETLGLVGESGSGKSATSLAMMRLLPPGANVSGSVKWFEDGRADGSKASIPPFAIKPQRMGHPDGDELLALPEEEMRRRRGKDIAMIFQEPMTALNPVMTVGQQIAEAALAHEPRVWGLHRRRAQRVRVRERVIAAMREVGLPDPERRRKDFPHQFSGGQRQRVLIAMAIVNQPRLLIADEPTTALDVTVQAQILALLRGLRERHGLAMLFISHDLAVVAQVADRVAVMQHGEIVEQGAVADVFARPQHPYTCGLLAAVPTMHSDRAQPLAAAGIR